MHGITADAFTRTIRSRRSSPLLSWAMVALVALMVIGLVVLALLGSLDRLEGWTDPLARGLTHALPVLVPALCLAGWWLVRSARRSTRVVAVDGDVVSLTLANGQVRRWDMNLAQSVCISRSGVEVRFSGRDRLRLPWSLFADRDRRWIARYIEELQAALTLRQAKRNRQGAARG
jgi:hypothetical protein